MACSFLGHNALIKVSCGASFIHFKRIAATLCLLPAEGGRSRNQRSEEKLPDSASIADSQLSSSPSVVVKSSRPEDGTLELAHTSPGSVSSYSTSRSKGSRRLEGDAGRAEISHFRNLTHDQLVQRLHRTMEERAKVFHQRNELKKEIPNLLKEVSVR